jgi:integrase/recombinase XerD
LTNLSDALAAYRICAKAEGKSPKTVRFVVQSVGYFGAFLGGDQNLVDIGANDLRRFIIALGDVHKFSNHPYNKPMAAKLSPHSIQTYCRGVKTFFSYLLREELIEHNPMEKVRMPRAPKNVVPTFSERDVEKLLSQPDKSTYVGFRDYVILLTFLDTGIRLSELANLRFDDIDFENGYLRVMGKGAKERYVPFGHKVAKALLKYRLKHRCETSEDEYFWLARNGRPLTTDRIEKIVSQYGDKAGLNHCYAHKLRHTSAVMYLRNGGDPFSLQKKLGHASLQMTRHYCNLADSDVRMQHLKFGVADRLRV